MNYQVIMARDRWKCGHGAVHRPCIQPLGFWVKIFVCHRQSSQMSHFQEPLVFCIQGAHTQKKETLPQEWVIRHWNWGEVHILGDWQFRKWPLGIRRLLSNVVNWEWGRTWRRLDGSTVCVIPFLHVQWHSFYASPMERLLVSVYL